MNPLYVAVDRSRLRVYHTSQAESPLDNGPWNTVASLDYPDGRISYAATTTDSAGRFPTSQWPGMSFDERLPLKEEHERRLVSDLVEGIERCLGEHPEATWHFAAGPGLFQAILRQLTPGSRSRLGRTLERNLAKLPPAELQAHFASS